MKKNKIIPVILSGGEGTRLWPLSRSDYPKQYLNLISNIPKSLFQLTYDRISNLENTLPPIIICNEEHRFIASEQMRQIGVTPSSIILEPFGRNTAAAITLAALKAKEIEDDPILLVLPADHHIEKIKKFREIIEYAYYCAIKGDIFTFGVVPEYPETGYGYIESSKRLNPAVIQNLTINRFLEKPDFEKAKELIASGKFTWNSGIYISKANIFLEEIKKYTSKTYEICEKSISKKLIDLDFQRIDSEIFDECPNLSIDVAIMEKTNLGRVIPLDVGWSDVGTWKSLWKNEKKDKSGNVEKGNVLAFDSNNSYLRSEERFLVTLGIENLIIVETSDVTLVAQKERAHEIKNILNKIKVGNHLQKNLNRKIYRPWGYFISVLEGEGWLVKKIKVNPGASLSLQMHNYRAEHWIVVTGIAKVEVGDKETLLRENQSTYIPISVKHRLSNPGDKPLSLIEVQSGSFIGEDDIIRFEDIYGRNN